MAKHKPSFFERLTGSINVEDEGAPAVDIERRIKMPETQDSLPKLIEEEESEGQLTVDVYQTPESIIIQSMVAGVRPDDLDISITREMVTVKGERHRPGEVGAEDYFLNELYWGRFSRTIVLPQEIEPEEAQAKEKNGLLIISLPKINKDKIQKLKVRSD